MKHLSGIERKGRTHYHWKEGPQQTGKKKESSQEKNFKRKRGEQGGGVNRNSHWALPGKMKDNLVGGECMGM